MLDGKAWLAVANSSQRFSVGHEVKTQVKFTHTSFACPGLSGPCFVH